MLAVDRADFCSAAPYIDTPQGIGYNATISAPHMHAMALEAVHAHLGERQAPPHAPREADRCDAARILDVGSGSGYLTVALAHMAGPGCSVVGIDHIEGLVKEAVGNASKNHAHLFKDGRLSFECGDGRLGLPARAPYDFIHVGAAIYGAVPQQV